MESSAQATVGWLLTYAIHSTLLLSGAWLVTRARGLNTPAVRDAVWKVALVGGMITASLQTVGVGGVFSVSLPEAESDRQAPRTGEASRITVPAPSETLWVRMDASESEAFAEESARMVLSPERFSLGPAGLMLALWMAGAAFMGFAQCHRRRRFMAKLGERSEIPEGLARELLDELCQNAGVQRCVRLTASQFLSSPVALSGGEICVPGRALHVLSEPELRGLLAHELAHVVRRDPLWMTISSVVQVGFFFQPLNRVGFRAYRNAAEELCDLWAARKTSDGRALAKCLVEVATWMRDPRPIALAGMSEPGPALERRVRRLVSRTGQATDETTGRVRGFVVAGLLMAIACGGPGIKSGSGEAGPSAADAPKVAPTEESRMVEPSPSLAVRPPMAPEEPEPTEEPEVAEDMLWPLGIDIEIDEEMLDFEELGLDSLIHMEMDQYASMMEHWSEMGKGIEIAVEEIAGRFHPIIVRGDTLELKGRDLTIRVEGDVDFEDGEIVRIDPGSTIEIADRRGEVHKQVTVTAGDDGTPQYDYSEDGEARPFNSEAEVWLTTVFEQLDNRYMRIQLAEREAFEKLGKSRIAVRVDREKLKRSAEQLKNLEKLREEQIRKQLERVEREAQRLRDRLQEIERETQESEG